MSDDLKSMKRTRGGRERVLAAAADLFGARTLAGTSLQMIADRLGMSKPAIYHHFRSRDDIVAALLEPVVAEVDEALASLAETSGDERTRRMRAFYRSFLLRHRRVVNMVFFDRAAMPGELPARIDELVDAVAIDMIDEQSEAGRARGMVLVYGMAALVARHPSSDEDELGRLLDAAILPAGVASPR